MHPFHREVHLIGRYFLGGCSLAAVDRGALAVDANPMDGNALAILGAQTGGADL